MAPGFKIKCAVMCFMLSNAAHAAQPTTAAEGPQKSAGDNQSRPNPTVSNNALNNFINADAPFSYDFSLGDHPSNIQFYGIIDIARTSINHSLPENYELPNNFYPYSGAKRTARTTSRTEWVNGGLQASRLGIKGEVGKLQLWQRDFKLMYQFEAGFNPLDMKLHDAAQTLADNSGTNANSSVSADSSLNGEFFARQAWVGIDGGSLGRVSYGTQYNPFFEITNPYDPNSKADTFSPLGESGTIGGGGGISENSRMKNSLKYGNTYNVEGVGKINYAGMYQFGNTAGTSEGYGYTGQLGFENSLFGVQFAFNRFDNAVKAGSAAAGNPAANDTISAALYNTEATLLALKWTPNKEIKFTGGWEWYRLKPSSDRTIKYNTLFDQTVFGGVATSALQPGFKQDNNVYYIGASYDFSQRIPALAGLTASVGYYDTRFDAIDGPTISTNSEGKIDTWTMIADYRFNKRLDTYVAYTNNHFSGDKYPRASTYHDVNSVGAGMRFKF
ncbi:porin [Methylophilus aquaticus]|nr:porin [Methylophilus aquaticus]